jgi:shikimate dehydrogenase
VGNRTVAAATGLRADLGDPRISAGGLDAGFQEALGRADLVVNATTVGMTSSGLPFDVGLLPSRACVFDLVYVPPATDLVTAATGRGLRAVNGIGMLVAQAAVAFERWTGIANPDPVMRQALEGIDTRAETRD